MSAAFEALLVRRRLILATTALLALTGLGSWLTMPREEDPQFPHRDGSLVTVFPGADALTVERLVLEPIEEHLAEVEQIDNIFSTARSGVVVQHIELHDGVYDTDTAWDDVRAAIDAARDEFPAGVLEPDLDDDLVSQEAIVYALVGSADPLVLVDAAERVKRELVSIRTVKRVNLLAEPGEQVIVEYDDATARRLGVDPERLGAQLGARSRIVPGGMVHLGDKAVTLRPQTEMRTLEEIRATPVLLASGASVPLSELARVRLAPAEPAAEIMRWNGEPAVGLGVVPQDGLDRVALGAEVRERVVGLEAELAPVRLEEVTFQPDLVSDRLSELTGSLRLGIFIVALILFVAMGPRLGLVVAMVVPLVTFGSMALFAGAGGILHQVSIAALVIALGMLVDNAIVMAENIQYRLDRGMPAAAAAAASVRELAAPLGTATATTLAAFVPMLVSKGATADFTRSIPTLIMLTLAVSYVFAVLVTPVLSELILRPRRVSPSDAGSEDADGVVDGGMDDRLAAADKEGAARRLGTAAEAVDGDLDTAVVVDPDAEHSAAMGERSLRLARWIHGLALGRPGWVLAGAVALLALSFFAIRWVDFKFFPAADRPTVVVDLDMPEGSHLETTDAAARSLERALLEHPDVASVATFVGRSGPKFYYNLRTRPASPHRASLIAEARSIDAVPDLIAWTREIVARDLPAASLVARRLEQGPPIDAPLEVRVRGHDLGDMEQVADRLLAAMREVEGTRDVRHDLGLGVPIMRFEIDDAAAARHGLSRADVGRVLS
ncbi:MAG: efflux RND transporter permease subunit, partial [Acidobacteriota bacterium]